MNYIVLSWARGGHKKNIVSDTYCMIEPWWHLYMFYAPLIYYHYFNDSSVCGTMFVMSLLLLLLFQSHAAPQENAFSNVWSSVFGVTVNWCYQPWTHSWYSNTFSAEVMEEIASVTTSSNNGGSTNQNTFKLQTQLFSWAHVLLLQFVSNLCIKLMLRFSWAACWPGTPGARRKCVAL